MKYILLLSILFFSCKKEVDVVDDNILITIKANINNGMLIGYNQSNTALWLTDIEGVLDTTIRVTTYHHPKYEIRLESADTFSVDISASGRNGVKSYHFKSNKWGQLSDFFTI